MAELTISDLIAIPPRRERQQIDRAFTMAGRYVRLFSFHQDAEERLDVWFRRGPTGNELFGLENQEAVSTFHHYQREGGEWVFGPWVQIINLGYEFFPITIVHELAHLVDRYHMGPRNQWTSASNSFVSLYAAYAQTTSARILANIMRGNFPVLIDPDGGTHQVFEDGVEYRVGLQQRAREMLKGHEVFARCFTAYVFYKSAEENPKERERALCDAFVKRVQDKRNLSLGADLTENDFRKIETPLKNLLQSLGWSNEG